MKLKTVQMLVAVVVGPLSLVAGAWGRAPKKPEYLAKARAMDALAQEKGE